MSDSEDGNDDSVSVEEYIDESGILDADVESMSVEELIEHSKVLGRMMLESMLMELHNQYDAHEIQANPFDQLRGILDAFEQEYNESLRPHLSVVPDNEED